MDTACTGSSHKGQRIAAYSIAFKLKVIEFAKANNNTQAHKAFQVDRKCIIKWRKVEESLKAEENKGIKKRKIGGGRKLGYPDIELKLLEWIKKRRDAGARVTGKSLKIEGKRLHRLQGNQGFKGSCGWLRKFMRRHKLSFRRTTHVGQKNEDILSDKMQGFLGFVTKLRRRRGYSLSLIGNMDETPLYVDTPGEYTMEEIGKKTISMKSMGHEKERFTVMLAAMADGTKLTPMVLFKGVRPPKNIPTGIIVKMCRNGAWANEEIIAEWLTRVWRRNNSERRLLVWDSFRAHMTAKVKTLVREQFNSDMAIIPGGCTSTIQPCDVSWNKPMKDKWRDTYDEWLVDGPTEYTKGGNRKPPNRELHLKWFKECWSEITPEVIK